MFQSWQMVLLVASFAGLATAGPQYGYKPPKCDPVIVTETVTEVQEITVSSSIHKNID